MKALITGASSGIGRDMARVLAKKGYGLILVARRKDLLEELKSELPVDVRVIVMDIGNEESCMSLYEQVKDEPIEILINNAGFGLIGAFDNTSLETELNMIDVNIRAVHILTKLFLKSFKQKNHGYILNVSSSAGFLPGPLMSTYYASKSYVLSMSQAIWEELREEKSGVYISALCPGPVPTEFNKKALIPRTSEKGIPSEYVAEYALRRMFQNKRLIIPGWYMRFAYGLQRIAPMRALLKFCYTRMKSRGAFESTK